jgi:hypothetical protein
LGFLNWALNAGSPTADRVSNNRGSALRYDKKILKLAVPSTPSIALRTGVLGTGFGVQVPALP